MKATELYRAVALARVVHAAGHDLLTAARAAALVFDLERASTRIAAYVGRAVRECSAARLALEFDTDTNEHERRKRQRREARQHDDQQTEEVTTV